MTNPIARGSAIAIAPACLAWGLQHAGALAASLLLNLEAVFTVVLTRPLADLDPRAVVFWKALLGTAMSVVAALLAHDRWPSVYPIVGLLACGAAGYGLSLRLYLRAQRVLGAARTGSLFAFGPFVGAVLAFALGDRAGGGFVGVAAACFLAAVWLHATEHHGHWHRHAPLEHEHEHAHRHDDGHHLHAHAEPVIGAHSHLHTHEVTEHEHPHGSDVHHRHSHH